MGERAQRCVSLTTRTTFRPRTRALGFHNVVCDLDLLLGTRGRRRPDTTVGIHVAWLICRPPYNPLPVLAAQLPPDSHCAMASQSMSSAFELMVDRPNNATNMVATTAVSMNTVHTILAHLSRGRPAPAVVSKPGVIAAPPCWPASGRSPCP